MPLPLSCPNCRRWLQLEARACKGCGLAIGFDPGTDAFRSVSEMARLCANGRVGVCNWLNHDRHPSGFCVACRPNRMIPDLTVPGVLDRWAKVESAKRRVVRGLLRLGLDLEGDPPLAFHVLYDAAAEAGGPPQHITGYLEGMIVLNLVEADDSARERIRREMGEPYRTLVGHFRHEFGHHYWRRLVWGTPHIDAFRRLFGDERQDYAAATQTYYAVPPSRDGEANFVSRYASMHPWEDFAETFAHYLHIVDTLSAMREFQLSLDGSAPSEEPALGRDPHHADTAELVRQWSSFAFAMNALNRGMGQPDLYPFSLSPSVVLKLDYVNRLLADATGLRPMGDGEQEGLAAIMAVLALKAHPGD